MKKILLTAALCATLLLPASAQQRKELQLPDIDGYTTLKGDFHIHTVFSDGVVWPTVRVDEAYREGLDVLALTEHIEYRPHKADISADHNRSYELIKKQAKAKGLILIKGSEITRDMPPGHFNALFLSDCNPLEQKEWRSAFEEAKRQNAFFFWNHPGWERQQPDTTLWFPEHTELYRQGCMHGIEVANGGSFFPEALEWALEKNLTIMGNTDIHQPSYFHCDPERKEHRTMTLLFCKERTAEGVREALESRRTAVYFDDKIIGREELLRDFFEACLTVKETKRTDKEIRLSVTNNSDLTLVLKKTAHDERLGYFRNKTLLPHYKYTITIQLKDGVKGGDLNFEVTNFIIGRDRSLPYTIKL